jgi:DNA-binding CsgD family transcriptional regulator
MERLVDIIYEAALAPDRWSAVLAAMAERYQAKGGLLFGSTAEGTRWLGGGGEASDLMRAFIAEGWMSHNEWLPRLTASHHAGFLTDLDLFSAEELATLPMYTEFITPRGTSARAATLISGAAGDSLILSVTGFRDQAAATAAVPDLDSLRPHLARAAMLSAQLQIEKVKAGVAVLETIGVPAAFVAGSGAMKAANALFEAEIGAGFVDTRASLRLMDERANLQLQHALEKVRAGAGGASIAIRAGPTTPARALHVIPVMGDAGDLFFRASAVLVVTRRRPAAAANAALLEHLYDLSHAEARVALTLMKGTPLREIATCLGTSIHTVRNQMKAVLEKTGAVGQTDLVTLLLGLTLPAADVRGQPDRR